MAQPQHRHVLEMEPFFDDEFESELNRAEGLPDRNEKTTSGNDSAGDILDCVTQDGYFEKLSTRTRYVVWFVGFCILCSFMYFWGAELAEDKVSEDIVVAKPPKAVIHSITDSSKIENPKGSVTNQVDDGQPKPNKDYGLREGIFSNYPIISLDIENGGVESSPIDTPVTGDGGACPALCESREQARNEKFGGDLLDLDDVLKMASQAHDKLIRTIRPGYGEYFDGIFRKEGEGEHYHGMEPITKDGPSRGRLKRKLKLKVLKMMEALKLSEENVYGCNCRTKSGSTTETKETFTSEIPDYYQKYVFANGGHSSSAGHGNVFKDAYSYIIGEDLAIIWDAIGVEMISRNMGMGAMKASPIVAACSKETFGIDVDLLSWNYAMTDGGFESHAHYVYRGAVSPGRPAIVSIDLGMKNQGKSKPMEDIGLAMFWLIASKHPSLANVPDSAPDGIPLTDHEFNKMPKFVKALKCGRRLETGPCSDDEKWSCTKHDKQLGSNCTCPELKKRNGWHPGFKMHALIAHFISLPLVDMLLEGISELIATKKDPKTLFHELQKEEDEEFEAFLTAPVLESLNDEKFTEHWQALGDELENFFKGPSLCRTSLIPSMTRFLGLATNSDKVGGSTRAFEEEYDTGYYFHRENGRYTYKGPTPPEGEIVVLSPNDFRHSFEMKVCPEIVMPDYKDWFYGNWTDGPISTTFPNEKEKEYYGYKSGKFRGILGLVPTLFVEKVKSNQFDLSLNQWTKFVDAKVNGKPVTNWKVVGNMAILEGSDGLYWEPSSNNDYTLEFSPKGIFPDGRSPREMHFRYQSIVLY